MALKRSRRVVGELAVIVVGVLLALTADRWVQGLDDREREQAYLQGVERDLQADSSTLAGAIILEAYREETARSLLEATEHGPAADTEPGEWIGRFEMLGWSSPVGYATATWVQLISTGDLALLRSVSLRRELSAYYEGQDALNRSEEDWERLFWLLEQRTMLANPPGVRSAALNAILDVLGDEVDLPSSGAVAMGDVDRVLRAMDEDHQLAALVGQAWLAASVRTQLYRSLLEETVRLLSLVRSAEAP